MPFTTTSCVAPRSVRSLFAEPDRLQGLRAGSPPLQPVANGQRLIDDETATLLWRWKLFIAVRGTLTPLTLVP